MAQDDFDFLVQLNKAQLVVIDELGLVPSALAGRLASAIQQVADETVRGDHARSADYLAFEKKMIALIGAEASNLHMGRSRNDIGATRERLWMRQELLGILSRFAELRRSLLQLAERHVHTVIPSYTHAVQAQPISLAHYLLALASSFARDGERLLAAYGRINQSPLGAGALATSGFPLDRPRLGELLGFASLCDNSYDCISAATADVKAELASMLAVGAINIGRFAQDMIIQHADPLPAITLSDDMVGGSSIMPQKRNPGPLEALRSAASSVIADASAVSMIVHNTPFGDVADARGNALKRVLTVTAGAAEMLAVARRVVDGLIVIPELCRAKVERDYSTMTELADTLLREAGVSFRIGHKVAGELAKYGRSAGKAPGDIEFAEVARIYREVAGEELPLSEEQVRQAIDPQHFVATRRGWGGPQPQEVERMLARHRELLSEADSWLERENERLAAAAGRLEEAFAQRTRSQPAQGGVPD